MSQTLSFKKRGQWFLQQLRDFCFPPICLHCQAQAPDGFLCPACWELSALLDTEGRCIHCFEPIDPSYSLCPTCAHRPAFPFPMAALFDREAPLLRWIRRKQAADALAGFAWIQWDRLGWDTPDVVVPLFPSMKRAARSLGQLMERPSLPLVRRIQWPIEEERWEWQGVELEEESTLLFLDSGCTDRQLEAALRAASYACMKKGYVLKLYSS